MSLVVAHENLILIKGYIENELDLHLKDLKLNIKCKAIKADGKKCTWDVGLHAFKRIILDRF